MYPGHSAEALALLVEGMCMHGNPSKLTALDLDILMDDYDAEALTTLFDNVGASLQNLRMEVGCMHPVQGMCRTPIRMLSS